MKNIVALLALISLPASAATGVFGSYAEIFTTSATVYVAQSYGGSNPAFQGADFGTFTVSDTLDISNASLMTFKSTGDVTGAEIQWRVYPTGDAPGAFTTVGLNFGANAPNTDLGGQAFSGSSDQEWGNAGGLVGGSIDLIAATSGVDEFTLEIFYRAATTEGDRFSNNGGSNYTATFEIVPEPSAALLGCLGLLGILRRRR